MAGLNQDLVYHMGRHSFASLVTLEEGMPIETISKMLGHSNINSTQVYVQVTDQKIFGDMGWLMKRRKKGDTVVLTEMSE